MNCTISIPIEPECTQGMTYPYLNNTFSIVVTYPDGKGQKALQTLTSPFADVSITQGIRSMYDIMDDASTQMEASLDRIMGIADDMVDALTSCMNMMIYAMIISVALTIGMTLYGGIGGDYEPGEPRTFSNFDGDRAKEFGEIGADIGKTATSAIEAICETIKAKMEVAMDMEEVKMAQINMHTCLEIVQHQMDTGSCRGQESSCFNDMRGCIREGMSDIKSAMNHAGSTLKKLSKSYDKVFKALDELTGDLGGADFEGNIRVLWGRQTVLENVAGPGNNKVCDRSGRVLTEGENFNCRETFMRFEPYGDLDGCTSAKLMVYSQTKSYPVKVNQEIPYQRVLATGDNMMILFCDDGDGVYETSDDDKISQFTLTLVPDTTDGTEDCQCPNINQQAAAAGGGSSAIIQPKNGAELELNANQPIGGEVPTAVNEVTVSVINPGTGGIEYSNSDIKVDSGIWKTSWTPETEGTKSICMSYYSGDMKKECITVTVKKKVADGGTDTDGGTENPETDTCGQGTVPTGLPASEWSGFRCTEIPLKGWEMDDYKIYEKGQTVEFPAYAAYVLGEVICIRGYCAGDSVCCQEHEVPDDLKDASDTMGGKPYENVGCDLIECCNYFEPGVEYGNCVAEFEHVNSYDAFDICAEYKSEYTACTINNDLLIGLNTAKCCQRVYGQFNCNIASQGSNPIEQIDHCCNTLLTYGWTFYSKVNEC
jgi:hypothetical protein